MREKTAMFIGHRDVTSLNDDEIIEGVEKLIASGIDHFLNGGMGTFDWKCARIVYNLKQKYPHIRNDIVIPYLSFRILEPKYFDAIVYPEGFEAYHFKRAIPERNKYMIDHACCALCYVRHDWGGAAKTYSIAKKDGLKLMNLAD